MNYEEFTAALLKETQAKLKGEAQVEISSMLQNNGVKLTVFTIREEGGKIAPNIYIDAFYKRFLENCSMSVLTEEVVSFYRREKEIVPEIADFCFDWEERKKDIFYRVVNQSKNRELLAEIPHVRFLDLAVVFYCMVYDGESGIGSVRITNNHKQKWGIHTKDLMREAERNTPKLFPSKIQDISQILSETMLWEEGEIEKNRGESLSVNEDLPSFYVISNERNMNGASAILYPNLLQNFADHLERDLCVLPSSIHEVIVVPMNEQMEYESLKETVRHINHLFVIPEEVLSNYVYYYSRENHSLEVC